ncbi:MAG: septal ring lytic transglycosylase RlpA family protein [Desulfobacterota bacterium]|nr:septal ring lytic transglycosylase RlpA family protein [Thermodesulfobacteriota bacterium]
MSQTQPRPAGVSPTFTRLLNEQMREPAEVRKSAEAAVIEYTVKPGDTLWKLGVKRFQVDPYQLAKDNGLIDPNRIYPGQKLIIKKKEAAGPQEVVASWYGRDYHQKPTASGEPFDMYANTLAHKTLPLGTQVRLTNPVTGKTLVGRVNDRGPFIPGRNVDLSYGLARELGLVAQGVGSLIMEVL